MKDTTDRSERTGPQKARRKPLTIDLPAEEVERRTPPEAPAPSSAADARDAGTGAAVDQGADAAPVSEQPAEAAKAEDGAGEREIGAAEKPAAAADQQKGSGPAPRAAAAEPPKQTDASIAFVPLLVAAVLGGVLVALVVVLLARGGFFLPPPDTEASDLQTEMTALKSDVAAVKDDVAALKQAGSEDKITPLSDELATLKESVAALQDREPVPASDTAALNDLEGRLAALSRDVEALKSTAPGDSSAVAGDVASLRKEVDALSAKLASAPGDDRITALEAKVDALGATIDDAAALAPAVAADALAAALEAGRPFASELAALRTLGVDAATLDALAPRADSGLPTLANLRSTFENEIAAVDLATPIPEGTGVMDRLVKSARGLVEVRPAHPTEGSDPAAVVTRIRAALDADDLKTALSEWSALPDAAKTATADFARDAEARQRADDLVANLRAEALSRLEAGR